MGKENIQLGTGFLLKKVSVTRDEYASYRMPYIVLRGRWCNIIVRNVHALSEEKSDDSEDSFYAK